MTTRPKPAPNYELVWFAIGLVGLAVLLALSVWRMVSAPGLFPGAFNGTSIKSIMSEDMFQHPGVLKLGPDHFGRQHGL